MPPGHHGQEVLKRTLTAAKVDSVEYAQAKVEMKLVAGKRGLDAVMDEYDLDALFMVREGHHSAAAMVGYPIGESILWNIAASCCFTKCEHPLRSLRSDRSTERQHSHRRFLHRSQARRTDFDQDHGGLAGYFWSSTPASYRYQCLNCLSDLGPLYSRWTCIPLCS